MRLTIMSLPAECKSAGQCPWVPRSVSPFSTGECHVKRSTIRQRSETSTGRGCKGRFTRGNPDGIGNPFARKVAQLRSALIERGTEQDIKDIAEVLILQARTGDHAAIKLLFPHTIQSIPPGMVCAVTRIINEIQSPALLMGLRLEERGRQR